MGRVWVVGEGKMKRGVWEEGVWLRQLQSRKTVAQNVTWIQKEKASLEAEVVGSHLERGTLWKPE